jgi:biopolymer transport protein ExbB
LIANIINTILLQAGTVTADTARNAAATAAAPVEGLTLWALLVKGGWLMLPIVALLFGAIYIFIERYITIRRASKVDKNFMNQIQDLVQDGKIDSARNLCKSTDTPVARMLDKGLRKIGKPIDDIEKALESAGKMEVYKLEKNLSILGTIAGIAPMFGFVGTIVGVIRIFYEISIQNDISIGIISGGLYQKMITSAAGLIVGILAHAGYHYLLLKIDKEIYKMEANAIGFVDLLQEPTI